VRLLATLGWGEVFFQPRLDWCSGKDLVHQTD